uniref:EGF-like domain-containing protein n=1 Tax=Chrysotila carterae TaxID=13221 RepID=A0A7S4BXD2_CHRCT
MIECTGSCVNGRCINGTCVCNPGWSGNQDIWTQDLSRWGGPNLNCPTPVYVLQAAWAVYLAFAALLWLLMPLSIFQQWRKFQDQRSAGKVICPSVYGIWMLRALKTFAYSGFDDAASAPALKAFIHSLTWVFIGVAAAIVLVGVYPFVTVSKSPFEHQEVHKLCAQLYLLQLAVAHIILSLCTALMGGRVTVAMNGIISNRLDLASRTNQHDILSSVANLRRTRLKIVLVFASCSTAVLINAGLFLLMELDDWLVFVGLPFDTQPMITLSLSWFSVLSYTSVPTCSAHSLFKSTAASRSGEQSGGDIEIVDLEQPEEDHPQPDGQSGEQEAMQEPEQAREQEPEQAREQEPDEAHEQEPEQAPQQVTDGYVGRSEGWDIGGPAHLAC